ncbi:MAG: hypothetical protein J1F39_02685 [Clostridiales bacterium]|nr:hypothetical protein [Clostridiales bacterium]
MSKPEEPTVLFGKSKWIWTAEPTKKNSNVIMRRTFDFGTEKPPARAFCRAACDTHYYMYVNGSAVVWNGGMNRNASHAFYDEFDIAKYLVKGANVIVVYCQYFGTAGRDLVPSERAGFIFECHDLGIYSDSSFEVYENLGYKTPRPNNCCYAGHDIFYDASLEGQIDRILDPAYKSNLFAPATELDSYPDAVIGTLVPRPIPLEKFSPSPVIARFKKLTDQFSGDTYVVTLPRAMRVTPYFEVTGNGQEKILIKTDRTACQGTFADEGSTYYAHSVEYITKGTVNIFECLVPMVGETLIFSMPRTVKVLKLGYREIGYNTARTVEFESDSDVLDTVFEKAMNTLYLSLGSTLIDTPERERTMWLGDSSIAAHALYLGYADAAPLVKKVIGDVLDYAKNDVLYSCVPGNLPADIPSHGLLALSEYGLFAQYRNFTRDVDLFRAEYERLCDYLMLWQMTEHGVALRDGVNRWYDNLYNIDESLVENALYYSACKFLRSVSEQIGNHDYDEYIEDRMENIAAYIESCWNGLGYTSRDGVYDDRANALIALTGLVPDDRRSAVARLIAATQNSSPYLEWASITALSALDRRDLALDRFYSRYALAAESECSTLGEDFNGFGTKCQSYQSAVIFELIQVLGGIDIQLGASRVTITPDFTALKNFRTKIKLAGGVLEVRYKYSAGKIDIIIENGLDGKVTLDIKPEKVGRQVERRTIVLNKGKNKFSI